MFRLALLSVRILNCKYIRPWRKFCPGKSRDLVPYFYMANSLLLSIGEDKLLQLWHWHSGYHIVLQSLCIISSISINLKKKKKVLYFLEHSLAPLKTHQPLVSTSISAPFKLSPRVQVTQVLPMETNLGHQSVRGAFVNQAWSHISGFKLLKQYLSIKVQVIYSQRINNA